MSSVSQVCASAPHIERREWMAMLGRASANELKAALDAALDGSPWPKFEWLRAPDIGLAMVRARIGGTGDPFNLGEVTLTRATLRVQLDNGGAVVGIALQMGRDKQRAMLAALADALLQVPGVGERLQQCLLAPLAARIEAHRASRRAQAARTRVEFFTMVRSA
jgi:alpha-D-ribose 1-methylphosphonate 5-triphosphate synthase subunit PhnG